MSRHAPARLWSELDDQTLKMTPLSPRLDSPGAMRVWTDESLPNETYCSPKTAAPKVAAKPALIGQPTICRPPLDELANA